MRHQLNCQRLLCPMPVIKVQDKIAECQPGDLIEACCTDPGVMQDIPAWCRIHGHKVIETREQNENYIIVVRVGETRP